MDKPVQTCQPFQIFLDCSGKWTSVPVSRKLTDCPGILPTNVVTTILRSAFGAVAKLILGLLVKTVQ